MIAKTTVAWLAATAFLYLGKITGSDWCMLTGCIFLGKAYMEHKIDMTCPAVSEVQPVPKEAPGEGN
jgi:hypothetical protein